MHKTYESGPRTGVGRFREPCCLLDRRVSDVALQVDRAYQMAVVVGVVYLDGVCCALDVGAGEALVFLAVDDTHSHDLEAFEDVLHQFLIGCEGPGTHCYLLLGKRMRQYDYTTLVSDFNYCSNGVVVCFYTRGDCVISDCSMANNNMVVHLMLWSGWL